MAPSTRRSSLNRRIERPIAAATSIAGERIPHTALHDEIARRAFELFLSRGGAHGHDLDDWFQAEREVLAGIWRGRVA